MNTKNESEFLRESLNIIRNLQKSNPKVRTSKSGLLKEDVSDFNNQERNIEIENFTKTLNVRLSEQSVVYQTNDENTIFKGIIPSMQNLGFSFSLQTPDSLMISAENIKLDSNTVEFLNNLKGYYDSWYQEKMQAENNV